MCIRDRNIIVVPSKTVPQGITALINFMPDLTPEENLENMTEEMQRVKTGQVTYAVRTTCIDGKMCIRDRVNIKNQDAMSKVIDMVPDLVNRFMGGKAFDEEIAPEAVEAAEQMAKDMAKEG